MNDKPGTSRVPSVDSEDQSMAQIREILFGEQSRHTEQQFAQLETRLDEQSERLQRLLEQRVNELARNLDALRADAEVRDQRQGAALDGLDTALRALLGRLDDRLTMLDSDQHENNQRLQQTATAHAAAIEQLNNDSVGREQLAALLEAMASQLRRS